MKGNNSSSEWMNAGYDIFAREGTDGLQVERLARIVSLNKSSFYYFFGDMEGYRAKLLDLHKKIALDFVTELKEVKTIEPDYLNLLVKYKTPVMFQMHLTRSKSNNEFRKMVELVDQMQDAILNPVWCEYLDVDERSDLGIRYFNIVRDTFYSRVSFQTFTYQLLQSVLGEARSILNHLSDQKNQVSM
jgi:AcrR family transcriptional regulator